MIQQFNEFGRIEFRLNGKLHNPSAPAILWNYNNGFNWYLNGAQHRYYGNSNDLGMWFIHNRKVKFW